MLSYKKVSCISTSRAVSFKPRQSLHISIPSYFNSNQPNVVHSVKYISTVQRQFIPSKIAVRNYSTSAKFDDEEKFTEEEREEDETEDDDQILEEIEKDRVGKVANLHPTERQNDAKKAVAVALNGEDTNYLVTCAMKSFQKNMLMVGPTGCGKTEIARRIAKIQKSPFVKVEATKYTEVGYHGKDVDTMIYENAIQQTKAQLMEKLKDRLKKRVDNAILRQMTGTKDIASFRALLETGALEKSLIEYQPKPKVMKDILSSLDSGKGARVQVFPMSLSAVEIYKPNQGPKKKITVAEYRKILESEECDKLLTSETIKKKAIEAVEQDGIVFIDEIDKICVRPDMMHRPSASDEGVQRDLLPIIEGTIVSTNGAFHTCKPSDLMPELQGRLPIRVELKGLQQEDLYRILTQTDNSLVKQQIELMKTEDDAISEIAALSHEINESVENIGARRLHTVMEKLLEECSYNSHKYVNQEFKIDQEYVRKIIKPLLTKNDLSKFIL